MSNIEMTLGATEKAVEFLSDNGIETNELRYATINFNKNSVNVVRGYSDRPGVFVEVHDIYNMEALNGAYLIPGFEDEDEDSSTYDWDPDDEDDDAGNRCYFCGEDHQGIEDNEEALKAMSDSDNGTNPITFGEYMSFVRNLYNF